MKSLKAVSMVTEYHTSMMMNELDSESEQNEDDDVVDENDQDHTAQQITQPDCCRYQPLFILYDCEGTGGVSYRDHIVEIAAVLQPLELSSELSVPITFQSLVYTSKRISAPGR